MRTLFLRIFIAFLLAIVGIQLFSHFLIFRNEPAEAESRGQAMLNHVSQAAGAQAVHAYETGGVPALTALLAHEHVASGLRATLLNSTGDPIAGAPLHLPQRDAVAAAIRQEHQIVQGEGGEVVAAAFVSGSSGGRYIYVVSVPRFPPGMRPGGPYIHMAIFLVIASLVCYLLARYLSAPAKRVRGAIGRLADGDLTTRVGSEMGNRNDELAQLGRDFDRMAERIESLVTSQRRLLTDISHELRSPLARLGVALDLTWKRAAPELHPQLTRIEIEAARLNEMIEQVLELARCESGVTPPNASEFPLRDLLDEVASDASFEASASRRTVELHAADPCVIRGDRQLLRSAIENVVRNALRYTPDGTSVVISLSSVSGAADHQAIVKITDHGEGVPHASLTRIFDVFYRVSDDRDRQSGGAGLGLAITARAVRLHNGQVSAHNSPGGGLVVEMRLPLASRVSPA
jgi:two-component system sensor histidine kinase CpxA